MRLLRTNLLAGALLAFAAFSGSAYGQCADAWVSQAVKQVKGSVNGSGAAGDCNINNYGGGHWTTYNDLVAKVQAYFHPSAPPAPAPVAGVCTDPWVTQAVRAVKGSVNGSGTAGDCNIVNYGGGHWTSYADLQNKVQAYFHPPAPPPAAGVCTDPWVTQAVRAVKGSVNGSGTAGDCNIVNYGGGHWTSYADLQNKVQAYFHPPAPVPVRPVVPAPQPQQPFQMRITSPTQGAVLGEGATINVTWTYTGTPSPSQLQNGVQILLVESGASLEQASLGSNLQLSRGGATVTLPRNFVVNPGFAGVLCTVEILDMSTRSVLAQTPSVSCNYAFAQ